MSGLLHVVTLKLVVTERVGVLSRAVVVFVSAHVWHCWSVVDVVYLLVGHFPCSMRWI